MILRSRFGSRKSEPKPANKNIQKTGQNTNGKRQCQGTLESNSLKLLGKLKRMKIRDRQLRCIIVGLADSPGQPDTGHGSCHVTTLLHSGTFPQVGEGGIGTTTRVSRCGRRSSLRLSTASANEQAAPDTSDAKKPTRLGSWSNCTCLPYTEHCRRHRGYSRSEAQHRIIVHMGRGPCPCPRE